MKRKARIQLTDYIFRFFEALARELDGLSEGPSDDWRSIPPDELEGALYSRLESFYVEFSRDGLPLPWLKIARIALVGWVRANYPKTYQEPE